MSPLDGHRGKRKEFSNLVLSHHLTERRRKKKKKRQQHNSLILSMKREKRKREGDVAGQEFFRWQKKKTIVGYLACIAWCPRRGGKKKKRTLQRPSSLVEKKASEISLGMWAISTRKKKEVQRWGQRLHGGREKKKDLRLHFSTREKRNGLASDGVLVAELLLEERCSPSPRSKRKKEGRMRIMLHPIEKREKKRGIGHGQTKRGSEGKELFFSSRMSRGGRKKSIISIFFRRET